MLSSGFRAADLELSAFQSKGGWVQPPLFNSHVCKPGESYNIAKVAIVAAVLGWGQHVRFSSRIGGEECRGLAVLPTLSTLDVPDRLLTLRFALFRTISAMMLLQLCLGADVDGNGPA